MNVALECLVLLLKGKLKKKDMIVQDIGNMVLRFAIAMRLRKRIF